MLAGLMLQAGLTLVTVKLALLALFIFMANPAATHALAKAALARGVEPRLAGEDAASKR
jgi:multicomponent Na+:H+ antiporter subunit G